MLFLLFTAAQSCVSCAFYTRASEQLLTVTMMMKMMKSGFGLKKTHFTSFDFFFLGFLSSLRDATHD